MSTSIMSYALGKSGERISAQQRFLYALLGLCAYLALVSSLRFRRCRKLHRAYPYRTRGEMSKMTDYDAWAIQKQIMQGEFPFMMLKALQFALFRVGNIDPRSNLKKRRNSQTLNTPADIRHSNDIKPPPQNVAILRPWYLIQAIRRYRHVDWRIHSIRAILGPGSNCHCSNQVSAQGLPG